MSSSNGDRLAKDPDTMDRVTVRLTDSMISQLEAKVEAGVYPTRSEAIRSGVRQVIGETNV